LDRGPRIIDRYSKQRLVEATHRSWNSMLNLFAGYPRAEYRVTPSYTLLNSGTNVAMLNRVLETSLAPEDADETISEVIQTFESRRLPFTWQVDPWDRPSDLAERLERAGFHRDETPGMAVKISDLAEPEKSPGFSYVRVESPEQLHTYAWLLGRAYGMPEHLWDWLAGAWTNLGVVHHIKHYVGYLGGTPVATSSILYSDGVAGLYNVATQPEARGRGVGGMISYVPFKDARELGYRFGILHSSRMGYSVYRRLGFEEICKLIRYQWSPAEGAT